MQAKSRGQEESAVGTAGTCQVTVEGRHPGSKEEDLMKAPAEPRPCVFIGCIFLLLCHFPIKLLQ